MFMTIYVSLVARLVPLLLMTSLLLAGTKWIHETLLRRKPALANGAAVLFCLLMMAAIVPYAMRVSLTAGTTWSLVHEQWAAAAQRVEMLQQLGGHMSPTLHYDYGIALLHLGRFGPALHELEIAAASPPGNQVPAVGAREGAAIAAFFLRDDRRAVQHLQRIPDGSSAAAARDYLLGRIAERHGRTDVAEQRFRRSLADNPRFHPALYRLLRLQSMRHDVAAARATVAEWLRQNPAEANAAYLKEIMAAIERGEVLVDYELYNVADA
jgi:tetratricopeptide (TPR) repeat protein